MVGQLKYAAAAEESTHFDANPRRGFLALLGFFSSLLARRFTDREVVWILTQSTTTIFTLILVHCWGDQWSWNGRSKTKIVYAGISFPPPLLHETRADEEQGGNDTISAFSGRLGWRR